MSKPVPGSQEAAQQGCLCPVSANHAGRQKPDNGWVIRANCVVHGKYVGEVSEVDNLSNVLVAAHLGVWRRMWAWLRCWTSGDKLEKEDHLRIPVTAPAIPDIAAGIHSHPYPRHSRSDGSDTILSEMSRTVFDQEDVPCLVLTLEHMEGLRDFFIKSSPSMQTQEEDLVQLRELVDILNSDDEAEQERKRQERNALARQKYQIRKMVQEEFALQVAVKIASRVEELLTQPTQRKRVAR